METQFQLLETRHENETLKSQVVNSPDRLLNEISSLTNSLEEKKGEVSELEHRKREINAKYDSLLRQEKDLGKVMTLMEDIESEMNKCKKTTKDMKLQKASIETNQAEMLEFNAEEQVRISF